MTSPSTVPYTMPEAASLPACGPAWSIDPRRSALLVQHVQKYLLRLLRDSAPVGELLANLARLTHSARSAGVPVVYVARAPGPAAAWKGAPGPVLPGPPAEAEVRAFADVVQPQAGDTVLTAKRYSAFAGTRLRARLNELGRDQLVVAGALARTDVLLTAADAWMQDLQPFVVIDAVLDTTAADHAMAVRWLAATCAAVTATGPVADTFRCGCDAAAG